MAFGENPWQSPTDEMSFEQEKRAALRILHAVENGGLTARATYDLVEDADPALIHLIFAWIRTHYPPHHPAAEGVLGRLVEVCRFPKVAGLMREGASDPIVTWFEDTYEYRELDAQGFIDLVVEKLEG